MTGTGSILMTGNHSILIIARPLNPDDGSPLLLTCVISFYSLTSPSLWGPQICNQPVEHFAQCNALVDNFFQKTEQLELSYTVEH